MDEILGVKFEGALKASSLMRNPLARIGPDCISAPQTDGLKRGSSNPASKYHAPLTEMDFRMGKPAVLHSRTLPALSKT